MIKPVEFFMPKATSFFILKMETQTDVLVVPVMIYTKSKQYGRLCRNHPPSWDKFFVWISDNACWYSFSKLSIFLWNCPLILCINKQQSLSEKDINNHQIDCSISNFFFNLSPVDIFRGQLGFVSGALQ